MRIQEYISKKVNPVKLKNYIIGVQCATDFPNRITKIENLHQDLLQRGEYAMMKPLNLLGDFQIVEGHEEQFKQIAREHGFFAAELIICD